MDAETSDGALEALESLEALKALEQLPEAEPAKVSGKQARQALVVDPSTHQTAPSPSVSASPPAAAPPSVSAPPHAASSAKPSVSFPMLAPSLRPGISDALEKDPPAPATTDTFPRSVSGLADIERIWPDYLTRIETAVPKFLVLQMQRVRLVELDSDGLHLAVDQEFGARMVEEHLPSLMDHMKELTGQRIRFRTRVERSNRKEAAVRDPYEQFKKIQQNDPIVKEIVELFGAELRYE